MDKGILKTTVSQVAVCRSFLESHLEMHRWTLVVCVEEVMDLVPETRKDDDSDLIRSFLIRES